ncbi:MAG TPA: hypothetical protein VJR70_05655 [Stellaceae bacterium]|nr:hypothetical protein [Stellaceae bacterium]
MIAMPDCDKVLLVQAELDGELDAAAAAALAAHRADCPVCEAAAAELSRARTLIDDSLYQATPADVRGRIMARLAAARPSIEAATPSRPKPFFAAWRRWWQAPAGFGIGAACATALAFFVLLPRQDSGLVGQLVASHIRALQPGHLEDVVSTDRHTVKPWFDGRIDFAPPVKDLAAERFPLKGGRLDYIDGRPVAALVYQRDKHLIDLFVWPVAGTARAPEAAERQGYNVVHWAQGGMNFWAVSDVEAAQLREFAEDWRRSP